MTTKLDNHNANGRELFADDGFLLVTQTTGDGAKLAREAAAQQAAREAAEKAQMNLFATAP
jgi:hypothetical protein